MRDSSTQRAIMAWSVVSRNESMAPVLYLLHAIDPGLAAVGRLRGKSRIANWQYHPILQFTA
jgi:hypothetical protein